MHAPAKTRWNSVFDCINRALQLKDAITRFLENDMELDGWIDGEDDENTSDGKVGRVIREMVRTTHPNSLLFLYRHISPPAHAPPFWGAPAKNVCVQHTQGLPCGGSWHAWASIGRAFRDTGDGQGTCGFVPPWAPQR